MLHRPCFALLAIGLLLGTQGCLKAHLGIAPGTGIDTNRPSRTIQSTGPRTEANTTKTRGLASAHTMALLNQLEAGALSAALLEPNRPRDGAARPSASLPDAMSRGALRR
ncbi:MAG: hypothetical protein ACK46X_14950 [Candidatus Sericytochromatia bacterium]